MGYLFKKYLSLLDMDSSTIIFLYSYVFLPKFGYQFI